MNEIRVGKCPVCGIRVETDYGTTACSDHREQVRTANKKKMAAVREKGRGPDVRT
jgi:hypothetical protein